MENNILKIFLSLFVVSVLVSRSVAFADDAAKDLFDQAQAAANQGETAKAIEYYERSIEANPDFAQAYSALASIYLDNNGKMEDVVWLYQQAAELEPQNAENYTNMCRAYFQSQQNDRAESACLKALSIDPNSGSAQLSLAWIYLLGKVQPADSIKYFNAVIAKIPNNPKIYYGLGMAYARNNEQAKALDVITNLRSMGQESLASQLEKMIRPSAEAAMMPSSAQTALRPPGLESGPSKVVKAKVEEPPPAPVVDPNAPPPGTIRIQLKAKLPPATDPSAAASAKSSKTKAKSESEDDGYDVNDYKPLSVKEMEDRVKKLRGNQRRGRTTASTNLNLSGSGTLQVSPAGN